MKRKNQQRRGSEGKENGGRIGWIKERYREKEEIWEEERITAKWKGDEKRNKRKGEKTEEERSGNKQE